MDGKEWVPPIKSRQPGTVKKQDTDSGTTDRISGEDHAGEVGKAKYIGFEKEKQLQKKDHGIHVQP
jgi:hypothetical protein